HGAGAAVLLWQIKGRRGHVPLYWRSRKRFSFYTLIHPPLQVPRPPPRAADRRLFRMNATLTPSAPVLLDYRRMLRRRWLLVGLLSVVILASILADFMLGPSGLGWAELSHALFHPDQADPTTRVIVWDIRLPYALMAVAVGLALGLAGGEMQTILNNPLASPFTLGISSAAAFGASLAIVLGLSLPGVPQSWTIAANAFVFALV